MGFKGGVINGLGEKCIFKNSIGFCKGLFDITEFFLDSKGGIILYALMNDWCAVFLGLKGIKYGRQFFIVHFNKFDGLFGDLGVNCTDRSNIITDISDLIPGQGVLISRLGYDPIKTVWDILTRYHSFYTG